MKNIPFSIACMVILAIAIITGLKVSHMPGGSGMDIYPFATTGGSATINKNIAYIDGKTNAMDMIDMNDLMLFSRYTVGWKSTNVVIVGENNKSSPKYAYAVIPIISFLEYLQLKEIRTVETLTFPDRLVCYVYLGRNEGLVYVYILLIGILAAMLILLFKRMIYFPNTSGDGKL